MKVWCVHVHDSNLTLVTPVDGFVQGQYIPLQRTSFHSGVLEPYLILPVQMKQHLRAPLPQSHQLYKTSSPLPLRVRLLYLYQSHRFSYVYTATDADLIHPQDPLTLPSLDGDVNAQMVDAPVNANTALNASPPTSQPSDRSHENRQGMLSIHDCFVLLIFPFRCSSSRN
jgi:hypothetical protein